MKASDKHENTNTIAKTLSSWLLWATALLLSLSAVLILISVMTLVAPGRMDYIRAAIFSHGITGGDTINTYLVLHIATRFILLAVSGVFSFGMLYTLIFSRRKPDSPVSGAGFSAMIRLADIIHKLIKPLGAAVGVLFGIKLIIYLVSCYSKRYVNSIIFSFFATVFGELLLGLIAVGVLFWIYKFSAAAVDDITSIQYSLVTGKSSAYGISTSTFFSLCACAAISLSLAFAMSYDLFAFAAFVLAAIANLLAAVFIRGAKKQFEELAYEEYMKKDKSPDRIEEPA